MVTWSRSRRAIAASGAALAVSVGAVGLLSVGAAPAWSKLASGNGAGRGDLGGVSVSVQSTTSRDPHGVRFSVTGTVATATISWRMFCWNEDEPGETPANKTGIVTGALPFSRDLSSAFGGLTSYDYCQLEVRAIGEPKDGDFESRGRVVLLAEARYG